MTECKPTSRSGCFEAIVLVLLCQATVLFLNHGFEAIGVRLGT